MSTRPTPALVLTLALFACTPQEPIGATTASSSSGDASTSDATTLGPTTGPASTGDASTTASSLCTCHADCEPGFFCEADGRCQFNPNDCGGAVIILPIQRASVVLVLDKSGSMGKVVWDGDGDPNTPEVTRWRSLRGALESITVAYERSLDFGAVLSPSTAATMDYSSAACPVEPAPEAPVLPMNAAALLAALPPASAQGPGLAGATPTRAALTTAIAHITPLDRLPRALVLVTDGGANCSPEAVDEATRFETYDEAVVQVVADAAAAGITTFVVGLAVADLTSPSVQDGEPDATNLHDRLNELALAGGAPLDDPDRRFYGADDQPGIEAALTAIAAALLPCVVPLDPIPIYPDAVTASVGGVDYGPSIDAASCVGVDGWRYLDAGSEAIELCGQACASFRSTGEVELFYDIPPVPEPPQCPHP